MKEPCVYIITNKPNGILYIGVTSNLPQRIFQHQQGTFEGFSKKYDLKMLVWYEFFDSMDSAIAQEKRMKEWNRAWKVKRILEMNPQWDDLSLALNT